MANTNTATSTSATFTIELDARDLDTLLQALDHKAADLECRVTNNRDELAPEMIAKLELLIDKYRAMASDLRCAGAQSNVRPSSGR